MDIKSLALAHGEKLGLGVIGILSVWLVYGVYAKPDYRAHKDANTEKINEIVEGIKRSIKDSDAPRPADPTDYATAIQERFSASVGSEVHPDYLSSHPDYKEIGQVTEWLYAYFVGVPSIETKDEINVIQLTVHVPETKETGDKRSSVGGDFSVERTISGGSVVNTMRPIGVYVEMRIGERGDFIPLEADGQKGFFPLETGEDLSLTLKNTSSTESTYFRAHYVVAGTGRLPSDSGSGYDVIVRSGEVSSIDDWSAYAETWQGDELCVQVTDPAGRDMVVDEKERVFMGTVSEEYENRPISDVKIALKDVSVSLVDQSVTAKVLVRMMYRNRKGDAVGWIEGQEFKVGIGDKIGGKKIVLSPKEGSDTRIEVDLSTDFVLESATIEGVDRVWYWEIKKVGSTLVVESKVKSSEKAVLRNTKTDGVVELIRLERNIRPPRNPYAPLILGDKKNEEAEFVSGDIALFRSPSLVQSPPVKHEPSDALLYDLDPEAQTNQAYYEFGNGLVVYYNHIDRKMKTIPEDWKSLAGELPVLEDEEGEADEALTGEEPAP